MFVPKLYMAEEISLQVYSSKLESVSFIIFPKRIKAGTLIGAPDAPISINPIITNIIF